MVCFLEVCLFHQQFSPALEAGTCTVCSKEMMGTIVVSFLFCLLGEVAETTSSGFLFVFGDSYADTGNHRKDDPNLFQSWRVPYGQTWPGQPTGRFSDGYVLTDFIAQLANISSPLLYKDWTKQPSLTSSGLNFAFGGSGVFNTFGPEYPNITVQIDQFQGVLKSDAEWKKRLSFSSALVVYSGNDYSAYLKRNNKNNGLPLFISIVVTQMLRDLNRLYEAGIRKFIVTTLPPTGCLPFIIHSNNFTACNQTDNTLTSLHNRLLSRGLQLLARVRGAQVITLDQYDSFVDVLSNGSKFGFPSNPLQPCCLGTGQAICGSVDPQGIPLYSVCSDPQKAFFWDGAHPTQAGWTAITQHYRSLFR